ncbi:MAG: hypothetical protein PHH83_00875 [Patescibacteria group bacterium]|nr:hypothetical protein [Patescibacteria group bacterium]
MGNNKKNILFISYIFPPQQSGGTQRISQFFNVLNQSFNVFVITTKDSFTKRSDPDNIFRVCDLLKYLKNILKKRSNNYTLKDKQKTQSFFIDFIKKIIYLFVLFPDEYFLFIPFAIFRGIKILRKNKIDYIFSTYPPSSNLVIGWILSKLFNIRHVVDLREPWLDTPDWSMNYSSGFFVKLRIKIENFIEKIIIKDAYRVILNNRWMKYGYEKFYNINRGYNIIPNGFDESLINSINLNNIALNDKNDVINIIYAGSYYSKHQPDYLFEAIHMTVKNNPNLVVSFTIFGEIDYITKKLIKKYKNFFSVKYLGYINKKDCLENIVKSDLSIIQFPYDKWSHFRIPGKIYECEKLNVHILVLGDKDGALEFLSRDFNNKFIEANDVYKISEYISNFKKVKHSGVLKSGVIDAYNYNNLNKQFIKLFI